MEKSVSIIGLDAGELPWLRLVVGLLRHPDPAMSELIRQALIYLNETAYEPERPADQAR